MYIVIMRYEYVTSKPSLLSHDILRKILDVVHTVFSTVFNSDISFLYIVCKQSLDNEVCLAKKNKKITEKNTQYGGTKILSQMTNYDKHLIHI